jgi:hypothetical protein
MHREGDFLDFVAFRQKKFSLIGWHAFAPENIDSK